MRASCGTHVAMLEVVRRISARLAVTRAEGAAVAFFAAVALRQPLGAALHRFAARMDSAVSDMIFSVSAVVARQQLSRQRGGIDGRTSATTQIVKTLHSCLDATGLYRAVMREQHGDSREPLTPISSSSASGDLSRRLEEPWHSCPGEVYFRGASPNTTGPPAPRGLGGRDLSSEITR